MGLALFISPYNLTLNSSGTVPTLIKVQQGAISKDPVTVEVALTVYEKGNFIETNLDFWWNKWRKNYVAATEHGISKVKSIFGTTDGTIGINTFSADVIQRHHLMSESQLSVQLTNGQVMSEA